VKILIWVCENSESMGCAEKEVRERVGYQFTMRHQH